MFVVSSGADAAEVYSVDILQLSLCEASRGSLQCFVVSAGAEFPAVHHLLQWTTQRSQAELVVPHVQGGDSHQLLQEPIHLAGEKDLTYC